MEDGGKMILGFGGIGEEELEGAVELVLESWGIG